MTAPSIPGVLNRDALVRRRSTDVQGQVFLGFLLLMLLLAGSMLLAVVWSALSDSWPIVSTRFWSFLTSGQGQDPATTGVWQGVVGSVSLAGIVAIVAFPVGIGAAIYLEEYAANNRTTRLLHVTVRNLAGVPSIVYGLLGLAIFVGHLGGITGGRSVISGGLTLACLVLPIVIITASEAVRAVPKSLREGSYGLGATKWEVIRTNVLPVALPGILTGAILSISRAIGEAAPLLVVGAVSGFFQTGNMGFLEQQQSFFTALPMNIFAFTKQPADKWGAHAAAAAVVILLVVFVVNSAAIFFRARIDRKLQR